MIALSLDTLKQMLDRRKGVLGEQLRRLEAATAVDTFVRIADRADDIGLRAVRNLRRFGWLFQELGAIPPRPANRRADRSPRV